MDNFHRQNVCNELFDDAVQLQADASFYLAGKDKAYFFLKKKKKKNYEEDDVDDNKIL